MTHPRNSVSIKRFGLMLERLQKNLTRYAVHFPQRDAVSGEESYAKGYLKGYEEGLKEAWDELIALTLKGYTAREVQVLAKSNRSSIDSKVQAKKRRISGELGLDLAAKEEEAAASIPSRLAKGATYLIRDGGLDATFALFRSLTQKGANGFCILRTHPSTVRKKYGIDCLMIWLTKAEVSSSPDREGKFVGEFLSPTELPRLATLVKNFLTENKDTIVVLEGLEYLITQNDFKSVLRFLQSLKDQVTLAESVLLMPLDPSALDEKDFKLLEREISNQT
ncbi:MAG: DUF835 domain-containing protein [Methanomassiliicoccales archaeon]|nr:DUF835 domain-containing protein [Methanomassiliicoccales archaeon]